MSSIGPKIGIEGEREYKQAIKNIVQETKTLEAQIKSAGSSFDEEASAMEKNQKQTDLLKKKKEALKKELDLMKSRLRELQQSDGDTTAAENKLKEQMAKVETQIGKTNDAIDKLGDTTEETAKDVDKSADAVDAMANVLIASGLAAKVEDVAKALYECVEIADQFESAMTKLSTVADTSAVSMEQLESQIMTASNNLGVGATELAEATYQAISASVDTAEAVGFVETATKLAEAGFTDATTATDVLTTAINAYGLATEEAEHIADVLVTTQNLGKTSVNELAQSMGAVIPIAQTYGVSVENLSSAYVELTRNGINTASATTDLKAMLSELGDSSKEVSKVLVEQTGKSFSELMGEGKSLGDVIDILSKAVDNDKTKFAELWASSRTSGVAALSLLNKGSKDYNEVMEQMATSAGTVSEAYEKVSSTSEFAGRKLQTSVNNLQIAIGRKLSPVLTNLQKGLTNIVESVTKFIDENPQLVALISALVTGLGTLVGGFTTYVAITKIAKVVTTELNAAMDANPIGMIALAIGAVVTALGAFVAICETSIEHEKTVADETREMTSALKESQSELADSVSNTADALNESVGGAIETAGLAEKAVSELEKLASKTSLTAEEQERMAVLVSELNTLYPEMNLQIDEQTGKLNMTNQELEAYVENMKNAALAEAYNRASAESFDALVKAQKGLTDAQNEQQIQQEKVNKLTQEYNRIVNEGKDGTVEYKGMILKTEDALQEINTELYDAEKAQTEFNDTVSDAEKAVNDAAETANEYTEQYVQAKSAVKDLSQAEEETAEKTEEMAKAQEEAIKRIQSHIDTFQATLNKPLASTWFDELQEKEKISAQTMSENLQKQIDAMLNWEQNMNLLAKAGIDDGLLQYLAEMGPEGAAYVQGLCDDVLNNNGAMLDQINAQWQEKYNISNLANEEGQELVANIGEAAASVEEAMSGIATDTSEAARNAANNTSKIAKSTKDDMNTAAKNASSGSSQARAAVESNFASIPNYVGLKMQRAAEHVREGIAQIRSALAVTLQGPNIQVPHFTMSGTFNAKTNSVPSINVSWYAKAMEQAHVFNSPSLIGVGEAGAEVVVGERHLLNMVTEAVRNAVGTTYNYEGASVNVNVYGAGQNAEQIANMVSQKINRELRLGRG